MRAPKQRVRVSEVLVWADRQLSAADWARVDQLAAAWRDAREEALRIRGAAARAGVVPWTPDHRFGLTGTECCQLALAASTEHDAQRDMVALVLVAYARDRGGEQLDLFADPAGAHDQWQGEEP